MQVNYALKEMLRSKIEAREGDKKRAALKEIIAKHQPLCDRYCELMAQAGKLYDAAAPLKTRLEHFGLECSDKIVVTKKDENFGLNYEVRHKRHLRNTDEILTELIVELTYSKGDEKKLIEAVMKKIARL